jgi:hypothetical protein
LGGNSHDEINALTVILLAKPDVFGNYVNSGLQRKILAQQSPALHIGSQCF